MMKRKVRFILIFTFILLSCGQIVYANVLWDTGPASKALYPGGIYPFGYSLSGGQYAQYAAGRLDLNDNYTLTKIEGWMATDGCYNDGDSNVCMNLTGGNLAIAIYKYDWSATPGDLVYRTNSFVLADGSTPNWYGLSNLNIYLEQGYYWISFEPTDSDFSGSMSTLHWLNDLSVNGWGYFPPNPMPEYTYFYGDSWHSYGGMYNTVGMRIEGTLGTIDDGGDNQVPEPATMLLLGFGITGLAAVRRFRK